MGCCTAGTLPPSWGALTRLEQLFARNNTLSGPLPGAWSGMVALEELVLLGNALTGTSRAPGMYSLTLLCTMHTTLML